MIYSTATVPVNPAGEIPLTRAQTWAGLVLKARDARQFLPPGLCTRCDVTEESATHLGGRRRSLVPICARSSCWNHTAR